MLYASLNDHPAFQDLAKRAPPTSEKLGCTGQLTFNQIRAGQRAWDELRRHQTWDAWVVLGKSIDIGRAQSLLEARANRPVGYRYNKTFSSWLAANKFDDIDKSTRSRLLQCIDNLPAIQGWLDDLKPGERADFNHPKTVLAAWKRSLTPPKDKPAPKNSKAAILDPVAFLNATQEARNAFAAKIGYSAWSEACPPSSGDTGGDGQKIKIGKHNSTLVKLLNETFGQLALGDNDKTIEALTAITRVLGRQN